MINFLLGLLGSIIEFSGLDPGLNTKKLIKTFYIYNNINGFKIFIMMINIESYLLQIIKYAHIYKAQYVLGY